MSLQGTSPKERPVYTNAGDKAMRRVNDAADVAEKKITAAAADAIAKALTKMGFTHRSPSRQARHQHLFFRSLLEDL